MKTTDKSFQTKIALSHSIDRLEHLMARVELGHISPLNILQNLEVEVKKLKEIKDLHTRKPLRKFTPFNEAWSFNLEEGNIEDIENDLEEEQAWVTFITHNEIQHDDFERVWFPVTVKVSHDESVEDLHLTFDSTETMEICRERWGDNHSFGIAPTSQMLKGNSVQDNF